MKRRRRERAIVVTVFLFVVAFTAIEVHLLRVSATLPFVNSIFFFGLMNLNILLVMVLLFLVFRNAVKVILDERRGRVGSRLKTRLVVCFLLFAIIPTILLFSISAFYIKNSFDKWFNVRIGGTLQKSIDVARNYYENTERNASHFARKISFSFEGVRFNEDIISKKLLEARLEYGLDAVEYHADPFSPRILSVQPDRKDRFPPASLETLQRMFSGSNECRIQNVGEGELIRCGAYLGVGKGVIFANYFIPIGLSSQLSDINLTYEDFKTNNPLSYPMKTTYFAILSMVTLLILFSATWTGFYVARRLSVPIEELSRGTEEVARGNLEYQIHISGGDEMARLVESFNKMTQDLRQNKRDIEVTHGNLKKMNEELSHRRRYIEILLENVQSGVISLDQNGKISMVNGAAYKLFRFPREKLLGQPYWIVLPEGHREEFRDLLLSVYGTSQAVRKEIRIRSSQDEWITLLVTLNVLRDENKRQMGVVAVFDDVTQLQQIERMAAWREVARRIAHEIKNPLTPIQLSVQRLRRRYLQKVTDDGTFDEATAIILKEVDSLKNMVSEFSSFARLPELRLSLDDLNEIILETVNLFRSAHEQVLFALELEEGLPKMRLDRAQLKRVLINLFDNAVAAMEGKGMISVVTHHSRKSKVIRIVVADEGCGIQVGVYSRIFEPYFSTKEGGSGLGLTIVQRIVTDHGGVVRVADNRPKGAKFLIEFPEALAVVASEESEYRSEDLGEWESKEV